MGRKSSSGPKVDSLKIVFLGGRPLGALCLKELVRRNLDVKLVVPNIDEFSDDLWFESTRLIAKDAGIPTLRTQNLNERGVEDVEAIQPDVILSIFFQQILRKRILGAARLGCINIHFAPLPRYRGFYPQVHAILNGETKHGVTMHFMDEGIDSGDIILQQEVPIHETDTGRDLYFRCVDAGLRVFKHGLDLLVAEELPRKPQDSGNSTYFRKEIPNGREIDWSWSAEKIKTFVRALTFEPFDPPYFQIGDRKFVIVEESRMKRQ